MQKLDEILRKTENLLSNPKEIIQRTRQRDDFDFNLLTKPSGQKLPEGFEVGVFTSSKGEMVLRLALIRFPTLLSSMNCLNAQLFKF
jgi:hypothetical protein